MMFARAIGLMLTLTVLTSGCDRPFVEATPPTIEVVYPNLDELQASSQVPVAVRSTSFRDVARVELNGRRMVYDPAEDLWLDTLSLVRGLNRFPIASFDEDDVARQDTLYAVYFPARFSSDDAPSFVEARGGHAATKLLDGQVLITGGGRSATGPAARDAFMLSPNGSSLTKLRGQLNFARVGHTATLLPDGRVLIVGGSRSDAVITEAETVDGLVSEVEVFDPETRRFTPVPVNAPNPIRRTGHSALLFQLQENGQDVTLLYLYAGSGDIRYGDSPRWGIRSDLRAFIFRNDSLIADGPTFGPRFVAISGHTQTALDISETNGLGRYLFAGSYFPPGTQTLDEIDNTIFQLTFSLEANIAVRSIPGFHTPRTRHAAAIIQDGLVGFFGGRQFNTEDALGGAELYVDVINRLYELPSSVRMRSNRWGHTATILANGRILLLGGFGTDGSALRSSEWFERIPTNTPPTTIWDAKNVHTP